MSNRDRQGSDSRRHRSHNGRDRDEQPTKEREAEKWGKRVARRDTSSSSSDSEPVKERANYKATGLLAEDEGETYKGRKLKWQIPDDMKDPKRKWTLLTFKDNVPMEGKDAFLNLDRSPAYMFGRDAGIVDVPVLHPSISMQHAVLVFRFTKIGGENRPSVKPYIVDLDSTNGTLVNGKRLDGGRYQVLYHQDSIKFGQSTREYMLMDSTDI